MLFICWIWFRKCFMRVHFKRSEKWSTKKIFHPHSPPKSKVERWRSHCFNYSSDFNCIFIVLYIYYSRYVCEWWSWTVRINPLKNDYYCRWFCPVGKMERRKRLKRERDGESKCRQRELIMIWITHTHTHQLNRSALDYDF